jgi:hypothetical protein
MRPERRRDRRRSRDRKRGKAIAELAGARTAEAIVPAIEPDDRYSGIARHEATDVAASRCRQSNRPTQGGRRAKGIVRMRLRSGRPHPI